jgi:hypothetical protein
MSDARHKIELWFEGGVLTAKLICPDREGEQCSEHEGHCNARDWFDNVSVEEIVQGKVVLPIQIDWPGPEEGPEMKLIEPEPGQRIRDERKIIAVFLADLPETVRLMNMAAIVEEIECGRDVTAQDEDLPPQEVYDRYQLALDRLEEAGILQSTYDANWGMRAYGLTEEGFDRPAEQVIHFLRKKIDALAVEVEQETIGPVAAQGRARIIEDAIKVLEAKP